MRQILQPPRNFRSHDVMLARSSRTRPAPFCKRRTYRSKRRAISTALLPPNEKELDMTVLISTSRRA